MRARGEGCRRGFNGCQFKGLPRSLLPCCTREEKSVVAEMLTGGQVVGQPRGIKRRMVAMEHIAVEQDL